MGLCNSILLFLANIFIRLLHSLYADLGHQFCVVLHIYSVALETHRTLKMLRSYFPLLLILWKSNVQAVDTSKMMSEVLKSVEELNRKLETQSLRTDELENQFNTLSSQLQTYCNSCLASEEITIMKTQIQDNKQDILFSKSSIIGILMGLDKMNSTIGILSSTLEDLDDRQASCRDFKIDQLNHTILNLSSTLQELGKYEHVNISSVAAPKNEVFENDTTKRSQIIHKPDAGK